MPNQRTRQKKKEAAAAAAEAKKEAAKPKAAAKPPPAPTQPGGRQRGVCRWFVDKKKYGFISSGDGRDILSTGPTSRRRSARATRWSTPWWIQGKTQSYRSHQNKWQGAAEASAAADAAAVASPDHAAAAGVASSSGAPAAAAEAPRPAPEKTRRLPVVHP